MDDKDLRGVKREAGDVERHAKRLKREADDHDERKFYRELADFMKEIQRL